MDTADAARRMHEGVSLFLTEVVAAITGTDHPSNGRAETPRAGDKCRSARRAVGLDSSGVGGDDGIGGGIAAAKVVFVAVASTLDDDKKVLVAMARLARAKCQTQTPLKQGMAICTEDSFLNL